jgi:hypothetical protein
MPPPTDLPVRETNNRDKRISATPQVKRIARLRLNGKANVSTRIKAILPEGQPKEA